MRRVLILLVVLLAAAYWAWPYIGAYRLVQAAARHDMTALAEHINEPALKRSLGRQIVQAYLIKSGRGDKMGSFERGLATAVGTTVASPYLDQLLSPEALSTLLAQGRIGDLKIGDRTVMIDRSVPSFDTVLRSRLLDVVLHSFYDGIASFRFSVPDENGNDYGVHLRLNGLTWRLSGLDLPPEVLDRIASDAIAAERASGNAGG